MSIAIRRARADDAPRILTLVRAERLNPTGLDWANFWVVERDGEVVGAAQVRPHPDGARELGSVVVAPAHRGGDLGHALIGRILAHEAGPVYAITARTFGWYFAPLGFAPRSPLGAPRSVLGNFIIGQMASGIALFMRRRPRRLVMLERPATTVRGAPSGRL